MNYMYSKVQISKVHLNAVVNSFTPIPSAGKKVARKLSDVEEEEEEEEEDDIPDLEKEEEEEGEKENEDLCNEGQTPLSKPKNKCKRTNGHDATSNKSIDQKNKTTEKSKEQGTGSIQLFFDNVMTFVHECGACLHHFYFCVYLIRNCLHTRRPRGCTS